MLVAARQLLRSLSAFDGNDCLPKGLTNAQVRDAVEHWDTPGGSYAAKRLSEQGVDPSSHVWKKDGPGGAGRRSVRFRPSSVGG